MLFLVVLVVLSHRHQDNRRQASASLPWAPWTARSGLLFGLVRGAVLVCLAWLLAVMVVPPQKEMPSWITEARSLPLIEAGAGRLRALIPDHLLPEQSSRIWTKPSGRENPRESAEILVPPAKEPVQDDASGYNDAERTGMDRLHQSVE